MKGETSDCGTGGGGGIDTMGGLGSGPKRGAHVRGGVYQIAEP